MSNYLTMAIQVLNDKTQTAVARQIAADILKNAGLSRDDIYRYQVQKQLTVEMPDAPVIFLA